MDEKKEYRKVVNEGDKEIQVDLVDDFFLLLDE